MISHLLVPVWHVVNGNVYDVIIEQKGVLLNIINIIININAASSFVTWLKTRAFRWNLSPIIFAISMIWIIK